LRAEVKARFSALQTVSLKIDSQPHLHKNGWLTLADGAGVVLRKSAIVL
jgi:hypothetical protein